MKISEAQVHYLMNVLKESLSIHGHFSNTSGDRTKFYSSIISQQSNKVIDLDPPSKCTGGRLTG